VGRVWSSRGAQQGVARCPHAGPWLDSNLFVTLPLILDEPTAPLDPLSEAALLRTLRELARDRIVILVTHRAATLAACTCVYFVSGGGIAASGTHRVLLASDADYRRYLAVTEPALPVD